MAKPYPMELRERVWKAYKNGEGSEAEVAERFAVSPSFVRDLLRLERETGSIMSRPHGGGHPPVANAQELESVREVILENPDATFEELRELLAHPKDKQRKAFFFSIGSLSRALKKLRLTRKKERPARQRARHRAGARLTSGAPEAGRADPCQGSGVH